MEAKNRVNSLVSISLFGVLLASALLILFGCIAHVIAKPVGPNPDAGAWPVGTIWGTVLHMENGIYIGEAWFGARIGPEYTSSFAPPPGNYIYPLFIIGGSAYDFDVKTDVVAPQHFSWYVELRRSSPGAPENATISSVMENADTWFAPQDFSVVLDNSAQGIFVNLRAGSAYITGLTKYATLYVDNAVNIENIENLDPLSGNPGDPLRLRVTVKNTGRYTDNYRVWCDGGVLDPENWTGGLAPGASKIVTLTTTLPSGTENIVITAEGNYAKDQGYITATGALVRRVDVSISPSLQHGLTGENLVYIVTVKNMGGLDDSYDLAVSDNTGWGPTLDDNRFENVTPGENRITTLRITIPENAVPCTEDNITVTAAGTGVTDSDSCIAHAALSLGVEVSISPQYGEGSPGSTLNYIVTVKNVGGLDDSYDLAVSDNTGWGPTVSPTSLTVPAGENRTSTLKVTIPESAENCTRDNITVTVISQADSTVRDNASCIAHAHLIAKPVAPNPDTAWPPNTIWGTVLHMENGIYIGEAWFGAKTGSEYKQDFPPPPGDYIYPLFIIGGSAYDYDVKTNVAAPQHFSWYVELRRSGSGAPTNATISSVMEDADTWFVPQDFSVVLDNSAQSIFVNLRKENGYITGLTKYATLYVDNAVNIQSIDNLDPLIGKPGDPLRLNVTVKNTGRYTDNYRVWCDGGVLDPENWIGLAPGASGTVTLTTALPSGPHNIVITAEGDYAEDQGYITAGLLAENVVIILRGKATAYNINQVGAPPWITYEKGSLPPIMVAQRVGTGAAVAAGIAPTCRNTRWNGASNPYPYLDKLLDKAFQWMVPGATKVLWFQGYGVYNDTTQCSALVSALDNLGYTVTGSATSATFTSSLLAPYDILVIPQLQLGSNGGDPTLLPDADVQVIKSFAQGGGGVLILDGSDFGGHNFPNVQNKILIALGFTMGLQDDQMSDDTNRWGGATYQPIVDVDVTTDIGAGYQSATGSTEIGGYNVCTMAVMGPGVGVKVVPDFQAGMPGETIQYSVKVFNPYNPGAVDSTYNLTVTDNAGWSPTISPTSLLVRVGEKMVATLSVTIPNGASLCTEDKLVVTAVASDDADIKDSFICVAHAGKRIEPTDDAYVTDQDNTANYGDLTHLNIGRYNQYWQYIYLKFDLLGEIPPGANITGARLYLFCYYPYGPAVVTTCSRLTDDSWSELSITWNNKPAPGTALDTVSVGIGSEDTPPSYSWDVTSFVQHEFAGDKEASFVLTPPDNLGESNNRGFESKDWPYDNRVHPFLRITYTVAPPSIGWDALITATFSDGRDKAIFGVRPDASSGFDSKYDVPKPPAPPGPPYVRAYFYYPEQTPDELHRSYLAPENLMEWPLRIEYADNTENITLTWNVENIPLEYSVLLYRGGALVADMRAEDNYTFEASPGSHDFKIVVGTFVPFILKLTQGWNMISLPVMPQNPDPDVIFGGAYYVIYRWDAENRKYVLYADSGSSIEPDPNVETGVGYWIFSLENRDVTILGIPLMQSTLNLWTGYNMVGSLYFPLSIADPTDTPDNSVLHWAFTWDANKRRYTMGQLLEPGKGYWIYALRNCSFVLPIPKLAIVYDIGGRGDLSFNDMAYMGGKRAEQEFGVKVVEFISKSEADYLPNLRAAAADPDVKLVVGVGYLLTDAISTVETEYPDKDFMNIDSVPARAPNALGVLFEEHKGSALVGALATMLAAYYDYPHIGVCLGIEIPVLWKFEIGYKWGCDWAMSWIENNKPEMEQGIYNTPRKERVLWTYTGTFSDITKGYDTAKAMYAEGAIAVYNVAGPLGIGINQAVNEIRDAKDLTMGPPFWIGVDSDQDWMNPSFCIASMMKRVDYGVYYTTQLVVKDKFRDVVQSENGIMTLGMGTSVAGIPMEGIKMSDLNDLEDFIKFGEAAGKLPMPAENIRAAAKALRDNQPSWIWNAVSELETKIRNGEVTVPLAMTENVVNYWRGILG